MGTGHRVVNLGQNLKQLPFAPCSTLSAPSGPIIGIDADVIQGKVAGIDHGLGFPLVQVDPDGQGGFFKTSPARASPCPLG